MALENGNSDPLDRLRWLAASDPKEARAAFQAMLHGPPDELHSLLSAASRLGDGRLRQMIAIVFRTGKGASVLEPWLRQWLEVESDEFTRAAIESALASRVPAPVPQTASRIPVTHSVAAYRYVSDRLCHRVRNALTLPSAQIKRLENVISEVGDSQLRQELAEILSGLQAGFLRVSRNVQFDTGDDYLTWQPIPLIDWLESRAPDFATRYGAAQLSVSCDPAIRRLTVRGTKFLLETVFGNLWANATQAAEALCTIRVECALNSERGVMEMFVLDSGSGFSATHLESAFTQIFSTKSESRGRGLLEVADAVTQLRGSVELAMIAPGDYRIRIQLPVERE
jgi:signal transduction histidine kinase